MKNVFFALAFMLISSLSFASTGMTQPEEVFDGSITVDLPCDIEVTVSWDDTIPDEEALEIAVEIILLVDEILC